MEISKERLELKKRLDEYLVHIKKDYDKLYPSLADHFSVHYDVGNKFIKVYTDNGTQKSVHSFIVRRDTLKWKAGDILKAATWKAPSQNYRRGNLLTGFAHISWTGAY